MRRLFQSTVLLLVFLVSVSCSRNSFEQDDDRLEISISSTINQIESRATSEGFENGDAVGMYAVNYSKANTVPGVLLPDGNQADNIKYIFYESAEFNLTVQQHYRM